ncbi:hypothetical protein [Gilliamella sp. Bif1-4]|uniref:hypothetical protein n=1 Tax=Gilliamella sp. Bif1-4 TaxID=3120233 RepID=UPI00080E29B2|nr:hypothetical protein [Gilliamella apicola]OCG42294.1 hypothetical protein A9G25_02520 [Gilliamella apicola]
MKKSFYKLPLLLVLFYWIFDIVFVITYSLGVDEYFFISSDMTTYKISRELIERILLNFILQLPSLPVLFITSVLLLNKYAINQINRKNIVNSLFIAILITLGDSVVRLYYYTYIDGWIRLGRQYLNFHLNMFLFLPRYITNFLGVAIVSFFIILLTYLGIKLLNKSYTHNDNALTQKESQQLHLGLFIALYNCYFLTAFLTLIEIDTNYSFRIIIDIAGLTIIFLLIANFLGYFLLRRCFKGVTKTIALKKLVFSSIGIFILNCLLSSKLGMFSVSLVRYLEYWYEISELEIIIIYFMTVVTLFILSSLLVRMAVKLIFGNMDKNHQSI